MNLSLFLPETYLSLLATALMCLTLAPKEKGGAFADRFMLIASLGLAAVCFISIGHSGTLFYSTYRVDLLSQGFKAVIALGALAAVLLSADTLSIAPKRKLEYYLFLTTATLGMMMIASSVDLLTLYISLELSSYSLYLLAGLRSEYKGSEAAVKYILFGAATSGVMLWGFSLIAGLSGTTALSGIAALAPTLSHEPAFLIGLLFATVAFLFKLSAFPAHFWAPDVYESSATPVTAFIATASKAAAVAVLVRFFMWLGLTPAFTAVIGVLAFISMTVGNAAALVQRDVKRILAYSSVAQAGYILVGLLAGSFEGYSSAFFYALAYVVMNTGAFLCVLVVSKAVHNDNPQIQHFDGLAERQPFLSLILLLSLLSLAGIPPLVGFTGKWILFSAAMDKGHWFLVLWGVLNSVVSLFYYLTIVKHAYLEKPKSSEKIILSAPLKAMGLILFCSLVFLGIFPNAFIEFARSAVSSAGLF